jgi:hypothetical protein
MKLFSMTFVMSVCGVLPTRNTPLSLLPEITLPRSVFCRVSERSTPEAAFVAAVERSGRVGADVVARDDVRGGGEALNDDAVAAGAGGDEVASRL